MRLLAVGHDLSSEQGLLSRHASLGKKQPRRDNFAAVNVSSRNQELRRLCVWMLAYAFSRCRRVNISSALPRIIPAGQSSLTAFGNRQCACAVAADAFDIGT